MKVMIVKEVMTGDVSPVAMFLENLFEPPCLHLLLAEKRTAIHEPDKVHV